MICYKDEKLYVSANEIKTAKQLDREIEELELKIYGRSFLNDESAVRAPMIYDVQQDKLVKRN